jgi:hypothetical protein
VDRLAVLLVGVEDVALRLESVLSARDQALLKAGGHGAVSIAIDNTKNKLTVNISNITARMGAFKFK